MKPRLVPEQPALRIASDLKAGEAVLKLTRQMSVKIGLGCLHAIAGNLAEALQADVVFVGEFTPDSVPRVKILAASGKDEPASLTFELGGSACSRIAATGKPFVCRKGAHRRFPSDPSLSGLNADACIAVPLQNLLGRPIGVMLAVYRVPPACFSSARSILEIFGHRAAAELLHKQEKDQLRKSEQRYHAFVALNEDGMWCAEFEPPIPTKLSADEQLDLAYRYGCLSECNDAAVRWLGLDQSLQIAGRRFVDLFPQKNPAVRKAIFDLIGSDYRFTTTETASVTPDGKHHFVLISHLGNVEDGMLQRIWAVTHDITAFKQIQYALDTSQRRMIDLLESVQLLVLELDPLANIQLCNSYFTDLTGWRPEDLKGKNWFDLIASPEERAALQEKFAAMVANPGKPIHFESTLLGSGGRHRQVAWDSTALRDAEGKVTAIANIGRDVTQEKALEAHLGQAQKIEMIGRLAGGIAHDFNNLLTVITGYTAALLCKSSPADSAYSALTEIQNAAEKGSRLTQQLLMIGRRRPYEPEVLNLNAIVERDAWMLRRALGGNIDLITNLDPSLGPVRADPGEISQVVLNLVVNARDAMPTGGKVTIASSNAPFSTERGTVIPGIRDGEYVQLSVTDTGTGMAREALDHLFEPFFTTKASGKGTGLGLSIIYGIVQRSGGHIKVESEAGRGTCFRIFLPRAQSELRSMPQNRDNGRTAMGGGSEKA